MCNGNAGISKRADWYDHLPTDYIAICSRIRLDLAHDLAHAWEQHNLDDETRQEFMDIWGLEHWLSHEVDWHERGGEEAANTIAFGLILDYATGNSDILRFACGYPMLTGRELPHADAVDCSKSEPSFT